MERTYVFNFIFKVMAAVGIFAVIGTAGMSDFDLLPSGQIFLQGGVSFLVACIGIWGAINCSRAIEASKRRARRAGARRDNVVSFPKAA